jgi:hypothetical protein
MTIRETDSDSIAAITCAEGCHPVLTGGEYASSAPVVMAGAMEALAAHCREKNIGKSSCSFDKKNLPAIMGMTPEANDKFFQKGPSERRMWLQYNCASGVYV